MEGRGGIVTPDCATQQLADGMATLNCAAQQLVVDGTTCYLRGNPQSKRLLVQPVDDHDLQALDDEARTISQLAGGDYLLAAFKVGNWNTDLAPWEAPPVFGNQSFGSGAGATLAFIGERLLPAIAASARGVVRAESNAADADEATDGAAGDAATAGEAADGAESEAADGAAGDAAVAGDAANDSEATTEKLRVYLGGYSLAGLFALWAGYQSDLFDGIAAASPSVWYPNWANFAQSHTMLTPLAYLSLGDKEERTRNQVMAQVGKNIRLQHQLLAKQLGDDRCVLEMNHGGHFVDPAGRTARAFAWLLERSS